MEGLSPNRPEESAPMACNASSAMPSGMRRLRDELRTYVLAHLRDPYAVVAIDEISFPKRGNQSAGVARQYCGSTKQVENCQVWCVRQRSLSGRLPGSIHIHDHPMLSQAVPQPAWWRGKRRSGHQILLKEDSKGFYAWLIQSSKKATEGGTTGKVLAAKEGHEGGSKGQEMLIKRLGPGFSTHRISDEHGDKVDGVIETKAGAGKPHPLLDGRESTKLPECMSDHRDFPKPAGGGGNGFWSNLDFYGRMRHTFRVSSLERMMGFSPSKGTSFLWVLPVPQ